MRSRYVLGFLFSDDGDGVLLLRKARPEWQEGNYNGIGGHIEEVETDIEAMRREFAEETGVWPEGIEWEPTIILDGPDFIVYCYRAYSSELISIVDGNTTNMHDEPVEFWPIDHLPENRIPNLVWLIEMSNDHGGIAFPVIVSYNEYQEG
jgi:8-oxo-dGTP pyrophosphatase MutT (NUDIX family)